MEGIRIDETFRYENAQLTNATVSAGRVTVKNSEVVRVDNGRVHVGNDEFCFSVYEKAEGVLAYNVNNVSEGIDAFAIIGEFITFVEADIISVE